MITATPQSVPKTLPVIPNFEKFGEVLYDRMYVHLKLHETFTNKFTILLNLLNRASTDDVEAQTLVYCGTIRQRELLNAEEDGLDDKWEGFKKRKFFRLEMVETGFLFAEADQQKLTLNDFMKIGTLKEYFAKDWRPVMNLEYPILKKHFNLDSDFYISVPIYSFGKLQGAVSIVFTQVDYDYYWSILTARKRALKAMCRTFMQEYDRLILDWDLETEGKSYYKPSRVDIERLTEKSYYREIDKTPILKDMGCRKYYELSFPYFEDRIKENNKIGKLLLTEHRRRAIIAILIDSFAHNISAHSLTVLKWWFQQRGEQFESETILKQVNQLLPVEKWGEPLLNFLEEEFPQLYERTELVEGIQLTLARWYNQFQLQQQDTGPQLLVRDQLFPLAKQLTPLFKFLLEKGAFWSGVTRDQQFGGEITNFFDILWNDFIQNPLYLGTIAFSEKITCLNVHIRIYEEVPYQRRSKKDPFDRTYHIKSVEENGKRVLLDGILASIDVGGKPNALRFLRYDYIEKGAIYEALKKELENCEVFFPGGVIGKHAFFTILENEIRNVKHYSSEEHEKMRREGLTLVISIRPTHLSRALKYKAKTLYKIGVWLNHLTQMDRAKDHLLIKRLENLRKDIITTETFRAKLGGNYQDKICAAMLFNNTFISVQDGDDYDKRGNVAKVGRKLRDQLYYPWIRAALSTGPTEENPGIEHDFEVRMKYVKEKSGADAKAALAKRPKGELAYFKKNFHLWRGDFLLKLDDAENLEVENVARFRVVQIPENPELFRQVRGKGVIRILQQLEKNVNRSTAYHNWLKSWLYGDELRIVFQQNKSDVGHLIYDETGVLYFSALEYNTLNSEEHDFGEYEKVVIPMAHSEQQYDQESGLSRFVGIRSHGILATKFFDHLPNLNSFSSAKVKNTILAHELVETLGTRLCIFDKRIEGRVPNKQHRTLLKEYLGCEIYGENIEEWKAAKANRFDGFHFVIMHLSFIESLLRKNGMPYGEKNIVEFIEKEIIPLRKWNDAEGKNDPNFLFVITTGRGRNQWWEKIQKSPYLQFVTFRPVESLIEAVEGGQIKKDDFELKYNLMKVLLGS